MTEYELIAILKEHSNKYKDKWEQVRLQSYYQVVSMVGGLSKPSDLFKFEWENENEEIIIDKENSFEKIKYLLDKI